MKEYPVFVPAGDEYVGAVVTVPDSDPRGVVVLVTGGGGAPRSHRYGLWTKIARELAVRDIASVRTEWPGVGDSTGVARMEMANLPVAETAQVARFAMDVTGTERLGLVGNCGGARTSLQVAIHHLPCDALALITLRLMTDAPRPSAAMRGVRTAASRLPGPIEKVARTVYRKRKGTMQRRDALTDSLTAAAARADVLILEPDSALAGPIPLVVRDVVRRGTPRRVVLEDLGAKSLQEIETREQQVQLIARVTDWFDECFPGSERGSAMAIAAEEESA
jgi:pimeloyl-ACP methyl ester carboxylesterase